MKILAFSDLHDEEDAFEKLKNFYSGNSGKSKSNFDAVFILGDTTNLSYSFLESVISFFNSPASFSKNCFFIPGNNEPFPALERAAGLNGFLQARTAKLDGFMLAGFGFSPPTPFGTPGELTEDKLYVGLTKLGIDRNTILLTHAPPYDVFDQTKKGPAGSVAIRRIIEEKQPFVNFCGHIHEHQGVGKIGETIVVKVPALKDYAYCVAEIKGRKIEAKFEKLE
ncbi:MAG: metallophosphoesterase [Candidatus Micrarchaeia archaeon]|jgi:hypothetical protein